MKRSASFLGDSAWGAGDTGIHAGRDVARQIMETCYQKQNRPSRGIRSYEDYREMLEKEIGHPGHRQHHARPSTRQHQHLGPEEGQGGNLAQAGGERAVRGAARRCRRHAQSAAPSHLLAYSNRPDRHTLAAWIDAGVIGTVREVHNWTNRPFWPQGMQEYHTSGPPVPAGFNWTLWQGPEPDRPYHPRYTFAVYRGWYAYGTGCLGDMGHYSLWQPYRILKLGVPEWVEARPNNDAFVGRDNVSDGGHVSHVGFPKASTVRWRHAATANRPSVDTFWYDGGMKPQTPEELYEDGEDLADEGMLFIGDKGKILCDFRGQQAAADSAEPPAGVRGLGRGAGRRPTTPDDEWVSAIRNGTKSKGSFEEVAALAEAVTLARHRLARAVQAPALGCGSAWRSRTRRRRPRSCGGNGIATDGRRSSADAGQRLEAGG